MPGPPTEIRIKRKATDDPVDILHVQNEVNGILPSRRYFFKRQRKFLNADGNPNPSSSSFTGVGTAVGKSSGQLQASSLDNGALQGTTSTARASPVNIGGSVRRKMKEPRRFHISRNSGINARGRGPPTVFIERRQSPEINHLVSKIISEGVSTQNTAQQSPNSSEVTLYSQTSSPPPTSPPRPQAPLRSTRLPSGKLVPWDVDPSILAAQMQDYTVQEIGRNLASSAASTPPAPPPFIKARQVSHFKPKAPALRYRDRYPERVKAAEVPPPSSDVMANSMDLDDEAGYVLDIYIRLPAEMFQLEHNQRDVGLLVLDSQPDVDEFYNDESDSDSEIYDEEEDENAENHPSTDYPEDEFEEDDENGRNAYQLYRNGNASDNEEYDVDDVTYSDDESRPPWAQRPWMPQKVHAAHEGDED